MTEYYVFRFGYIVVAEALVLWRMKWASAPRSFLDSLLMNFVSFLGLMLGLGPYITSNGPWGLTLFCTYSILVEGTVLLVLGEHGAKRAWAAAAVANIFSTLLIAFETVLLHKQQVVPPAAAWLNFKLF